MKSFPCYEFNDEKLLFRMQLSLPCDVGAIEPVVHWVVKRSRSSEGEHDQDG